MAQKSFPVLNRVNTSMIWDSYMFNNKNKWISNNYWQLCTFFYRTVNFIIAANSGDWTRVDKNVFNIKKYKIKHLIYKKVRFFTNSSIYLIDLSDYLLIINIYDQTNLTNLRELQANHEMYSENIYNENFEKNIHNSAFATEIFGINFYNNECVKQAKTDNNSNNYIDISTDLNDEVDSLANEYYNFYRQKRNIYDFKHLTKKSISILDFIKLI